MNEFIEEGMYGCGFTRDLLEDVVDGELVDSAISQICLDEAHDDVEFYREFMDYLFTLADYNKTKMCKYALDVVKDCSTCRFVGYTDILKKETIDEKTYFTVNIEDCRSIKDGKMELREFTGERKFEFYKDDGYGCMQRCEGKTVIMV